MGGGVSLVRYEHTEGFSSLRTYRGQSVLFCPLVTEQPRFFSPTEYSNYVGHAVAQLVEALLYKPEGRGFDSRWCHFGIFH
jgi:hypothetical protein